MHPNVCVIHDMESDHMGDQDFNIPLNNEEMGVVVRYTPM